jgi:hypothetical protein
MRLLTSALCATVASGLLCGCAGTFPAGTYGDAAPARAVQVRHEPVPTATPEPRGGIYVSQFDGTDILGYGSGNKALKGPICTIRSGMYVNDVAVDGRGNLIDPDGASKYVTVFKGPRMCGEKLGSFRDQYGQPSDASSLDAETGKIAVANIRDHGSLPGSLSICTLRSGCTSNLTNPKMYAAEAVAMARNDCWVDAKRTAAGGAGLIYFAGCAGQGEAATGFRNSTTGGIDIDNQGNLVIIDQTKSVVYIYRGCNPACTVVGGPFALKAECFFGKLNSANTLYATVDQLGGAIDFYSYSTKAIKFEHAVKGLPISLAPEGIAQNPRSRQ